MKKLERSEMKNLKGGYDEEEYPGGGGGACMEEYEYDCHIIRAPYPCCAGLKCANNATNTGTICVQV